MPISAQLIPIRYYPNSADWFVQIRHFAMPIWLDSGRPQSSYGRFDILSAAPAVSLTSAHGITSIRRGDLVTTSLQNPLEVLQEQLPPQHEALAQVPFCGGALGYFGYDLGRSLERLPSTALQDISLPDMSIGIYPWTIVQDHQEQQAWLVINHVLAANYDCAEIQGICLNGQQTAIPQGLTTPLNASSTLKTNRFNINRFSINRFASNFTLNSYRAAIEKIQRYIAAGDCYQVNFAQRFSAHCQGDSFAAYLALRAALPSPFSAYMELPEGAILSLSPERFIKLAQGQAETKPIKGTIARGNTAETDAVNAQRLQASLKDRAENLMIVDLLRNDLSKTCSNIQVPELFSLQSFANVHHLVSTVTGTLKPDKTAVDLLAASFPGGSITGAPKIRAMEIIEELEPVRRSLYCGSVGYISTCGAMDTSIAIRTLVRDKNQIHCWGGGGIVADSVPEQEYEETLAKVKVLLDTLEQRFSRIE